ncbi:MAG: ABC transporter ATP-binding protein [Candidatus Omnitrophota bacterium]
MDEYIQIKEASVNFKTKTGCISALKNIDFSVKKNEFISIIGPSGCGKTTLLKVIGNILELTTGAVTIRGRSAKEARQRREIGFVFQNPVLLPWRTVIGNVRFPAEIIKNHTLHYQDSHYEKILELVGIADFKDNHPYELSGGMQQRVAIARALSFDPSVLLMDEPFGALDEITRERMNLELLRIWSRVQHTILFVTHSIPEAVFLSDRIVVLSKRPGRIVDILNIGLKRPRDINVRYAEEFVNLTKKAHKLLSDEE